MAAPPTRALTLLEVEPLALDPSNFLLRLRYRLPIWVDSFSLESDLFRRKSLEPPVARGGGGGGPFGAVRIAFEPATAGGGGGGGPVRSVRFDFDSWSDGTDFGDIMGDGDGGTLSWVGIVFSEVEGTFGGEIVGS